MPSIVPTASLRSSDSSVSSCSDISVDANFCTREYMENISTDSTLEDSDSLLKQHLNDSNLEVRQVNNNVRRVDSSVTRYEASLTNNEVDSEFWLPSEPEDQEDDVIIDSVVNFKEEKLKRAMNNIRNEKFTGLVSQLVKSAGVNSSGNSDENWVDIVTSLSWEAANFVKLDTNEMKAMDCDGYVKVKCIATGLRTQSRLIKGLVFKKHAADKRMPKKYENPTLLLIHGSLDLSSGGLSSSESMQQEKNKLKSTLEMIEKYQPNVVLVEKSVSCDIQDSILSKGMTLVFDMNLHRLERVARCIGFAIGPKLWQCDSFRIEKFVEEHDVSHVCGKKPSKTLMFLEGCSSQLGCTIVLMGANSDELKRIKRVIRRAVVMAYHLMLETYFLLDQSAMFSTISPADVALTVKQLTLIPTDETTLSSGYKDSDTEMHTPFIIDIPISDGFHQNESENLNFPIFSDFSESSPVLDSESILVLMSRRNASKGIVCKKSRFSHIKFYRSFDVPLGNFLQDNLLNQKIQCKTCNETPEAHISYYVHHNKQLKIQVRNMSARKTLPGGNEGKIWMWSRCGRCKSNCTRRVLMSGDACSLSFGKFLELSFSNHSSFNNPSSCGYGKLRHCNFLYYFGLGPMVAMFEYSPVETYSVSLPSQQMEFRGSVGGDFLKKDYKNVYSKGISVFIDIKKSLEQIASRYVGVTLNIQGSSKKFSDILQMLEQEKSRFEVNIQDAVKNEREYNAACKLLRLNRIRLELLLESCIWDRRLSALLSSNVKVIDTNSIGSHAQENLNGTPEEECREIQIDGQVEESTGDNTLLSNFENGENLMWAPFSDILHKCMEDLERGYLPKIESFSSYAAESTAQKLITDEGSKLHIPLGSNEYIVSDYEDELCSIIACALTLLKDNLDEGSARKERGTGFKRLKRVFSLIDDANLESSIFQDSDMLDSLISYSAGSHREVSMGLRAYQGKRKYSVVCVFASQFFRLRNWCCPSEFDYIVSLSRCRNWDAKGGKSKSFFAKTLDDRFIIKEIQKIEFDSFVKFAVKYFEYMNQCRELGNQTCLAKILGIYQVIIRAPRNGKETRHDLLVMENLSFGRNISRQYDLKGALHARFSTAGDNSGDVLLDQNFVNDMNVSPLYVSRKSKRNLQRAIYNDTNFLNSINVMDYSLLVGVDTQSRELGCGIIDYLRQYTWDKQLENLVKSSLIVPKNQQPTIISPIEYKKRFRKFIDTHFLSVPDHWCSQRSSNLCGLAFENGSLHKKAKKRCNEDDDSSRSVSQKQGKEGSSKSPHHGKENGFFMAESMII
ncbi:hypothetical protein ABFS82_14G316700 [Erythranthe guttata]|uniref:putative 1-phosphatidylinositol-3-phosphate 5-kinase FAB1D n=1 Tax=Erythranthe guttata TaxID=4155 RepID=UPI00064D87F6|nr:PREDICTED: putative 1-phosphatidylinositol-3-phosphate 5-kinase FAB1D [Erythranthe guttata]XP_012853488.1 PREDICTED: putative 1-phosphatidylinositol-3-phosphate 5-kinase FAB1D [Erythranthe guttata]|eukprot:XP_012853487.1 PREDICTED: putative 1-phosphatidylinositol-3-phosphate 5-kinase FAB1D [Erythranthe guttata]